MQSIVFCQTDDSRSKNRESLARTVNNPGVPNAATSDGTDIGAFEAVRRHLQCQSDLSVWNDTDQCSAVVIYKTRSGAGSSTSR